MFRIIIATAVVLVFLAACGEAGGDTRTPAEPATAAQTPTTGPTATPTQPPGGAGGEGDGTVVPILTPFPSPEPVPDDWAVYTDPEGRFTVRYPPTWSANDYSLYSFDTSSLDPDTWSRTDLPSELIEVEMGFYEAVGSSGCGHQSIDAKTGKGSPDPGAAPATLGGVSGWQGLTVFDERRDGLTRIHGISVIYQGYCFHIAAYFYQKDPDEATFLQIADSFRFTDK
jgi:hypothetical protein